MTTESYALNAVAYSPDGRTLASCVLTVTLWDVTNPAVPRPLSQPVTNSGSADSVAFSPHVDILASGGSSGSSGTVTLWNINDPAHPKPLGQPLAGGGSAVDSVAFSPDGDTLVSLNNDGTVRLWNITDAAHPRLLSQPVTSGGRSVAASAAAFSPDGHTLASGSVQPRRPYPDQPGQRRCDPVLEPEHR